MSNIQKCEPKFGHTHFVGAKDPTSEKYGKIYLAEKPVRHKGQNWIKYVASFGPNHDASHSGMVKASSLKEAHAALKSLCDTRGRNLFKLTVTASTKKTA